jgi:hypothetical protein
MTEETTALPRKRDIEAAIAAYNSADRERFVLSPEAADLLAVMFRRGSVCQRTLGSFAAEGFDKATVIRLLRALTTTGFVSKDLGRKGLTSTYQLHLPPRRRRG